MCNKAGFNTQAERGLSLIELLVFIVIVGIAATAILGVFGSLTRSSASLLPDKQAQAIAASMLREIMAQPFTFCDPNDPRAPIAMNGTSAPPGCTNPSGVENIGLEASENYANRTSLDNVNDYNGYNLDVSYSDGTGVTNLTGTGYNVGVVVANVPGGIAGVPFSETLHVTVTVTPPTGAPARLDGVRIRYAPRT